MQTGNRCKPALEAEAIIQSVDCINREVTAMVNGVLRTIHVPPTCTVLLRGERVKLRMMQTKDRVLVRYSPSNNMLVANEIDVDLRRPLSPLLS